MSAGSANHIEEQAGRDHHFARAFDVRDQWHAQADLGVGGQELRG